MIVDTVSYALAQACKAHRNLIAATLDEFGLYPGQELVLMQLWEQEGLTQAELVERCRVEAPTVSRTLRRMEAIGVVSRRVDDADARVSRVFLTEKGRALREPVELAWKQADKLSVAGMTTEERLILRRLLVSLQANLP